MKFRNPTNNTKTIVIVAVSILLVFTFFLSQTEKPTSLNGLLRQGDEYVKEGKLSLAVDHYEKLVRMYPKSYEVHIRLGNLYKEVSDLDQAKVEYYRAMNLGYKGRYEAEFAMANLYASEGEYELGMDALSKIQDAPEKSVSEGIGDFLQHWGDKLANDNLPEAIRKYKEALKFYKKADSPKVNKIKQLILSSYMNLADEQISLNNVNDAINTINLSLKLQTNAQAYYKLARIYEKINVEKAISYYDKSFKINPSIANSDGYVHLLIEKANEYKKKGDLAQAQYYSRKAQSIKPNIKVPYNPGYDILVIILSTKFNENPQRNALIPGISYKILNVGTKKFDYLKVKVVFTRDKELLGEQYSTIADPKTPLTPDSMSNEINSFSPVAIPKYPISKNVAIKIYVSKSQPDKWKLYRNVGLS